MDPVSLEWNNHNSSLINSLGHFKAVDSFVDVTLVCEGHSVKAHKIILSAGSNVLRRLLLANPAKHPILILTETKYDTLRLIIDFLYKGSVDIPRDDLQKVLQVATTFEINDLRDLCKESLNSKRDDCVPLKSPILGGSSPKKKHQRSQSSDSDTSFEEIVPKKETDFSPCCLGQPEVSRLTDTLSRTAEAKLVQFRPCISNARTVLSVQSSTTSESTVTFGKKVLKDASTECDSWSVTARTELDEFHPEILDGRNITSVELFNGSDSNILEFQKDASTECDIQSPKKLSKLVPPYSKPAKSKLKPNFREVIEDSDGVRSDGIPLRRRRSTIWKYFNVLNESHAACKLCLGSFSYRTTITNLTKHLLKKHNLTDRENPAKLPTKQTYKDIDVNYIGLEADSKDEEFLEYEEDFDEEIPSTSTPCILKIT